MRKLLRLLLSRSWAAGALGILAVLLALAALVPDGERAAELAARRPWLGPALDRLRPAEVARSPVVLALASWVAAAIVASMVTRIRAHLGRPRAAELPPLERFKVARQLRVAAPPDEAERRVRAAARRAGFPSHAALGGARGGIGFWGSMAFHAGLLLVLLGVVLSARARFSGELVLTEGFPFLLSPKIFVRADPVSAVSDLRGVRLSVSDVSASYRQGTQLTDVSAVLTVERAGSEPERRFVSVNVPTEVDGFQLAVSSYGIAPELRAYDASGMARLDGVLMLRVLPPGTEDTAFLKDGGTLRVRYYPEHVLEDGRDGTRSMYPVHPVLAFRWFEGGTVVAEGRVARGEEATVGPYRVAFPEFSYWLRLDVTRDPGLAWFVAGALLGVLGLAVRFGSYEQAWRARLEPVEGGTRVEIVLSARYHPARLAERAARFAEAVEGSAGA